VLVLAGAAGACVGTNEPTGYVFQYQIGLYDCDADCSSPGAVSIDTVARGDTAWLRHDIRLLQTVQPTKTAALRPDCAQNVLVQTATANVDTVPTPTCPDSLELKAFAIGDTALRFNRWVVDSALAPGAYRVVGRFMAQPRIEPNFLFIIK
jgi:hypothetical protein